MVGVRKILVATDFSVHGHAAVEMACDMARRYQVPLEILHVVQIPNLQLPDGFIPASPTRVAEIFEWVSVELEAERHHAERSGVRTATRTEEGDPASEIVRRASEGDFDLVVIGTHGRTGIRRALLGSIAERVVRLAPCPVLTTRIHPLPEAPEQA
jgi:nucleotide-binding universal stress UspA family protein